MRKVGRSRRKSREKKSDVYVIDKKNCVLNKSSSSSSSSSIVVEKQEKKPLTDQLECITIKLPTNQAIKDAPIFLFFSSLFLSSSTICFYSILLKILLLIVFFSLLVLTHRNSLEKGKDRYVKDIDASNWVDQI
jgi:hypothetical protein